MKWTALLKDPRLDLSIVTGWNVWSSLLQEACVFYVGEESG